MATESKQDDIFRLGDWPDELTARSREAWLAGLGAVAAAEEEGTKLLGTLVRRGERFEAHGRTQLRAAASEIGAQQKQAMRSVGGVAGHVEDVVARTTKTVLDRFDLPTRKEVKTLARRVEDLSQKVDALALALERRAAQAVPASAAERAAYHVVPREDGWAVEQEGAARALSLHATKREAVESAREQAKSHAPSRLVIYKQDGTAQETLTYDDEA